MQEAEPRIGTDWYAAYYTDDYAASVRGLLTPERSAAEVDFILCETAIEPSGRVADIACGEGRHTLALAARDFAVTGVDQNPDFLARARAALPAESSVELIAGDMRTPVGGPYALALLLYHSFGFFGDDDNRSVITGWGARLAPGGCFVLDVWNRDAILRHFQPERVWQAAGSLEVTERSAFGPLTGRLAIHYVYRYADGREREHDASFRLYTFTELRDLFAAGGMAVTAVYGSLSGEPFTLDAPRLVVFARKL